MMMPLDFNRRVNRWNMISNPEQANDNRTDPREVKNSRCILPMTP
jgi:hypothetical protein